MTIRTRILFTFAPLFIITIGIVMLLFLRQSYIVRDAAGGVAFNIRRLEQVSQEAGDSIAAMVEQTFRNSLNDQATQMADSMNATVTRYRQQLHLTASGDRLVQFVTSPVHIAARLGDMLAADYRAMLALTELTDMVVVDRAGQTLLQIRLQDHPEAERAPALPENHSQTAWFLESRTASTSPPIVSIYTAPQVSRDTPLRYILGLTAPIPGPATGTGREAMTLGYVHQSIPLARLLRTAIRDDRIREVGMILTDAVGEPLAGLPELAPGARFHPDALAHHDRLITSRPVLDGKLQLQVLVPHREMEGGTQVLYALTRAVRENAALAAASVGRTRHAISLLQRNLTITAAAVILLTGFAAFFMARSIARPLVLLRRWTERIAGGDIDTPLPPMTAPDEIAELTADIRIMQQQINSRMDDLHADAVRKAAALEQSERLLKSVFDQSGTAILRCDLQGRILESNPAARTMLQYSAEELEARNLRDLAPRHDWETEQQSVRGLLDSHSTGTQLEKRYTRKDGTVLAAHVTLSVIRDSSGNPQFLTAAITDISEQIRFREALHDSEEQFRQLFTQMASGCAVHEIICDDDGTPVNYRFLKVNPAFERLTGWSADTVIGKTILELQPDIEPLWIERYGQVALSGAAVSFEHYNTPLDKHFLVSAYCPRRHQFAVIFRDITRERQALERQRLADQQLQQAQKLESLGVLAGGIAHDFNNLLMAILGNADLALADIPAGHPGHQELEEIGKASRRAAELCRQMLAYAGKGSLKAETLDLCTLIQDMADMLQVSVSKTVILRYDLDRATPPVLADVSQIRQIMVNLVTNASEAIGGKSGHILVSTGAIECSARDLKCAVATEIPPAPGLYSYIAVADTGDGMDAETCTRVCEPFFTTRFAGRGLGMSAVLGIVRSHNGAVTLTSKPNHGTTVRVLLPALHPAPQPAPVAVGLSAPPVRRNGLVLLVDDDDSVLAVGHRMLARNGYEVVTAADGREALKRFTENPEAFRCVVMDLMMPHMNGAEAFKAMRRVRADIRVILSSGYNEDDSLTRFDMPAPDGFIQKPYRVEQLLDKLDAVLARPHIPEGVNAADDSHD